MSETPEFTKKVRPFGDRIAVVPVEAEKKTKTGIIIPDSGKKDKPQEGIVVAVGDGSGAEEKYNPSNFFKVGDHVVYGEYMGYDIQVPTKDGGKVTVKFLQLDHVQGFIE